MFRRIIGTVLCFAILCGCIVSPVSANEQSIGMYTEQEIEDILFKFRNLDSEMSVLFGSDTSVVYWNLSNRISENGVLKWLLEAASGLIGEKPSKEDYVRILTNLLVMKQGNLAEQIRNQSQFDDLKGIDDYAWDVVDIAVSFIDVNKVADLLTPALKTGLQGKDLIITNLENAKYYEMVFKDYAYASSFLNAIYSNAKDEQLQNAAQSLLHGNDQLLVKRLEYLSNNFEDIASFEFKFFYDNLTFSLLKHTDLYATDEAIKFFVDYGSAFVEWVTSVPELAFKATILVGDLWFGTSDTYNRYQEMKIISDVAQALVADINTINLGTTVTNSTLTSINHKCNLYQMLILSHIRGEYLVYTLLTEDAGFASALKRLIDSFKDSEETVEGRYLSQIETLEKYYNLLYDLFPQWNSSEPFSEVTSGYYAQIDNELNRLTIHEATSNNITFTAWWYRIWDIYKSNAILSGNIASFNYTASNNESLHASGTIKFQENTAILTLTECTQTYVDTGEYRYKLIGVQFSEDQLNSISSALGVPEDLEVQITQGEPAYWEGGGFYRTPIEIYYNGELVAGASVNSLTGELAGSIYTYTAPTSTSSSGFNLESTFGFEKAWDIHDRSTTEHFVTSLAFNEDGTFSCGVGWYLSEWYVAFTGTYEVSGDEVILHYILDGQEKTTSYQVKWDEQTLRQASEENLVIAHQIGSEYPFDENPWYSADDLANQVETFIRYS